MVILAYFGFNKEEDACISILGCGFGPIFWMH